MVTNKALLIDIERVLTETKSGKFIPFSFIDWRFKDDIVKECLKEDYDIIGIIINRGKEDIFLRKQFDDYINIIFTKLKYIIKKPLYIIGDPFNKDTFFKYPYPGSIYEFAVENDVNLKESKYIAESNIPYKYFSIGNETTYSKFLLDD